MNKKMVVSLDRAMAILGEIEDKKCMQALMKQMNDSAEGLVPDREPTSGMYFWRRAGGPLSANMRGAKSRSKATIRRLMILEMRLHEWLPFLFRPRRYGFLPEQTQYTNKAAMDAVSDKAKCE